MSSSVLDLYKNQTIFITGGTGFVGKVLIEKLLRTCQVSKLVLMVRPKRGKTTEERFEKLISEPCFEGLKSENFDFKSKIELISGDCCEKRLGMSENDWNYLAENVNVVMHCASDVRFDRPLRDAAYINVRAVQDILELAKNTKNLKSLIYVSTAFTACHQKHIKDKFYAPGMTAEALLTMVDALDDETLDVLTPRLISKWQNTYVYTKAIAEDLVRREAGNLPATIVRPAIISGAVQEPMQGWIDNFYGPFGFLTGIYVGLIRAFMLKLDKSSDCVPVDYVTNLILAAGWKAHQEERKSQVQIYTYATDNDNIYTWKEIAENLTDYMMVNPSNRNVWFPFYIQTESRFVYIVTAFLLHTLPSYLMDLLLAVMGKKRMAVKGYRKFHRLADMIQPFGLNSWTWDDSGWKSLWNGLSESDKKMFSFNLGSLNWTQYSRNASLGARIYLVKDPWSTIDKARTKLRILRVIHYAVTAMLLYGFWKLFTSVLFKKFL